MEQTEEKLVEELKKDLKNHWKPNDEEEEARKLVYDRYKNMKNSPERKAAEIDWDYGDKQYQAWVEEQDEDDHRTNVNKPMAFAVIETICQETIDRNSRPKAHPRRHDDTTKTNFINDVLGYSFDISNFDYQFFLTKKESLIRGTAVMMEYYRDERRMVGDLEITEGEDGEPQEEYKQVERVDFDDLYTEYIPVEMFYIDPGANHIDKARDCIYREIIHIDEFYRRYSKKKDFKNIEYVKMGGDTNRYTYYETAKDIDQAEEVEVLHYYNRSLDKYTVVANDITIRHTPLPFPHKELPFTVLYCYKRPNKFYGIGIPKIIQGLVEEKNTLSNLRIDGQKMQLHKMFFYDDSIDLDELDLVTRPYGGIPLNTQGRPLSQLVQWVEYSDMHPSTYQEDEILTDDIRRTLGVDDRVQGLNVGGTATEAAILKESAMKRINMIASLWEVDSLVRLGRLRLENIKFFYPLPKIKRVIENDHTKIESEDRIISIKGKEYTINEDGGLDMSEVEGYSYFKMNEENEKYLEGEFDIVILPEANMPLSKPLQQAKVTEMFQLLTNHPVLMGAIDPIKAVRRYINVFDESDEAWMMDGIKTDAEMEIQAEAENELMASGYPLPPTPNANEHHTMIHMNKVEVLMAGGTQDQNILSVFERHISGEAAGSGALQGPAEHGGPREGAPEGQPPQPNMNPVDINPSNLEGMGGPPEGLM